MNPSRLILYRDRKGKYRWRLVARNGRIIADSGQGYARSSGRNEGVKAVAWAFGMEWASVCCEDFPRPGETFYFGRLIIRNDDDK